MRLIWLICLCIFVLTIPSAYAQEKAGISIDQILLFPEEKQEDIYLRLTDMVKPKIYVLERPDRLVIDTPTVQWKIKNPLGGYGGTLVKKVRFAQFNDSLSRLVFDLDGPVEIKETQQFIDRKSEQPIIWCRYLINAL